MQTDTSSQGTRQSSYRWLLTPIIIFLFTRLFIVMIALLTTVNLPTNLGQDVYADNPWMYEGFPGLWMRWDTQWYVEIALNGYRYIPGSLSSVSWFPVYPVLMRTLSPVFGNPLVAGLVISNVAFLLALIVLYRLVILDTKNHKLAARTLFYIAAFPTALFFSAVYTESLFLLLTLLCFYYARQERWGIASLAGMVAAATRIQGVILLLPVVLQWLHYHGWTITQPFNRQAWKNALNDYKTALQFALIPLGLAFYMVYLYITFDEPLAFWRSTQANAHSLLGPIHTFYLDIQRLSEGRLPYPYNFPVDVFVFLSFTFVLIRARHNIRTSDAAFVVASMLMASWSGSTRSISRYLVVLFPVFVVLARWGAVKRFDMIYRTVTLAMLGIYAILYFQWFFVG